MERQFRMAERWAGAEIQRKKARPSDPPADWLTKRVGIEAIDDFEFTFWHMIAVRLTKRDELWKFCSPAEYWSNLAGSRGLAVVRDGRPIAYVPTEMN